MLDYDCPPLKRFASIWTDGVHVGLMAFERIDQRLKPVEEWQSSTQAMNFDFAKVLKEWHTAAPFELAIVNALDGIEPAKHPVKRLLVAGLRVDVVDAILPFEGLASYQEALTTERLDLAGYRGGARLTERIKRLQGQPEPVVMAFLQGVAREPQLYTYISHGTHSGSRRAEVITW